MGLVYLPTWMVDFLWFSCRWIYQSHGSYGLRYGYSKGIKHVPFLVFCVLQRFQERTHGLQISKFQSSIWFFVCRKCMTTRHQQKKWTTSTSHPEPDLFPFLSPQKNSQIWLDSLREDLKIFGLSCVPDVKLGFPRKTGRMSRSTGLDFQVFQVGRFCW